MKSETIESPADFGRWFTAWLDEHKYVGVRKKELLELMDRHEKAIDILRRLIGKTGDPDDMEVSLVRREGTAQVTLGDIREVLECQIR